MGDTKPYLRLFTFAGVLILVSGLVLGLFNSAGAVQMAYSSAPTTASGTTTFVVNIEVPSSETVPIDSLEAVIEQQQDGRTDKVNAQVVSRADCPFGGQPGSGCTSAAGDFTSSTGDAITRIELKQFYAGQVGSAYTVGYNDAFRFDSSRDVTTTGYGYDTVSPVFQQEGYGYGYGYDLGSTNAYNIGSGYGYGYGSDDLIIQVEVDVNANAAELADGKTHYLTVLADTGSATIGDLSTPFTEFTVRQGGGGPIGGGGGGGGAGQGPINTGLARAFDVSQNQRVKIILENDFPGFVDLLVQFNRACQGCSIHMQTHGQSPPDGTPGVPDGSRVLPSTYFTLEVRDSNGDVVEGAISGGSLTFEEGQDDLGDASPAQVGLMHYKDGEWIFEPTELTSSSSADPLSYNASLSSFSTFATAVDTEGPSVTNTKPTGSTSAVTPTISADFEDNRGVDTDSFTLTLDGTEQTSQMGSLSVSETGFSFVPADSLTKGEHTVEATIEDTSGLSTTESWTFRISEVTCTTPPRITSVQPSSGATGVGLDTTITVTVQEGDCPIESSSLSVNGDSVTSTYANGELTAPLPSGIGTNETVSVTAQVTDTGGNDARRDWSFQTAQEDEGPAPGPDGDGGALVWIIIAIVVLAAIGVGAYFYTQQEGGGGAGGASGGA